jgi:hypothetical protein
MGLASSHSYRSFKDEDIATVTHKNDRHLIQCLLSRIENCVTVDSMRRLEQKIQNLEPDTERALKLVYFISDYFQSNDLTDLRHVDLFYSLRFKSTFVYIVRSTFEFGNDNVIASFIY